MNQPVTAVVPLDGTTLVNFIVGIFLPWAIAAVLSSRAPASYKSWFTLGVCFCVQLVVTFIGKQFVGSWSPNLWDNVWLVAVNFISILASCWPSFARFWSNQPAFQRVQESGLDVGAS